MRKLSLVLGLVLLGGVAYFTWPDEQPPPPVETVAPAAEPAERVPFLVKSKMRQIINEWKRLASARSAGDRHACWTKINLAVQSIEERLHADGVFAAGAMRSSMLAAAEELGYRRDSAAHLIDAVLKGEGEGAPTGAQGLPGVVQKAMGHALPTATAE